MRRVVVTGMGIACPLGVGVEHVWRRMLNGESGIGAIERFDTKDLPCKVAGVIPAGPLAEGGLTVDEWVPVKDQKKMDRFIHLAMAAGTLAVQDSGWVPETEEDRCATGVMIGSGIGGLETIYEASLLVHSGKARRLSPFFIPSALGNLASGHLSIRFGFKGPNHSVVTACATGVHALGDASRIIALGDADVMLAGGSEATVCEIGIAGFCASRALSTGFNDHPQAASRPWDKDRDGFVMGEGAGVVVIEELEHAKKRGATIYAELVGYGATADAYHLTSPHPEGLGAAKCMEMALRHAKMNVTDVQYINAHATSTPVGDLCELRAIKRVFGEYATKGLLVSGTKSMTGHLLGAAGGVELIASIYAIRDQVVPPTINVENLDPEVDVDVVPNTARPAKVDAVLSNSFGFGGHNAALLIKKF